MVNKTMGDDLVERLRKLSQTLDILECEDVLQAADRIDELEDKLAKAVNAIKLALDAINGLVDSGDAFDSVCAIIAELKGGTNGTEQ